MRRAVVWSVLVGIAALSIGCSAAEVEEEKPQFDLVDTMWKGTDNEGATYTFRFRPGGMLHYTHNGVDYEDPRDTWTQDGNTFVVSMTDGFSFFTGEIEGKFIRGGIKNKHGQEWTFEFRRLLWEAPPGEPVF